MLPFEISPRQAAAEEGLKILGSRQGKMKPALEKPALIKNISASPFVVVVFPAFETLPRKSQLPFNAPYIKFLILMEKCRFILF